MPKFEYLEIKKVEGVDLNNLGADGWELVAVSERDALGIPMFYFKRELADQSSEKSVQSVVKPKRAK